MSQLGVEAALRRHVAIPPGAGLPLQPQTEALPGGIDMGETRGKQKAQSMKRRAESTDQTVFILTPDF